VETGLEIIRERTSEDREAKPLKHRINKLRASQKDYFDLILDENDD